MATLSEFIRSNYNTSLTARNLHIQRQSLLYRLEKIESLTGLSLSCHRDLFLLEVYSRIFSDG
jgi:purine catabolism regulator